MTEDLYKDLGVNKGASQQEIKDAYRKKAQKLHPDHGGDGTAFCAIEKAHRILSDEDRRKRYDETGHAEKGPTVEQKADQMVAQMFVTLIQHADEMIFYEDIIKLLSGKLTERVKALTMTAKEFKERNAHLGKILNRLSRKTKKQIPLLEGIINNAVAANMRALANMTDEKAVIKLARKVLANYTFKHDEARPVRNAYETTTVYKWDTWAT